MDDVGSLTPSATDLPAADAAADDAPWTVPSLDRVAERRRKVGTDALVGHRSSTEVVANVRQRRFRRGRRQLDVLSFISRVAGRSSRITCCIFISCCFGVDAANLSAINQILRGHSI